VSTDTPESAWAGAFLQAQRDFKDPPKNKTARMGSYSYKYADLPSIVAMARKILNGHGLAFGQSVEALDGDVAVFTRIYHSLGHHETFGPVILPRGDSPQDAGSAITYARRYGLCAALGIAADEDNDASGAEPTRSHAASRRPASGPTAPQGQQANREDLPSAQGAVETSAPDTERGVEDSEHTHGEGVSTENAGGSGLGSSGPEPSARHDLQDRAKRLYGGPASLLKAAREKYGEDILTGNHITDEQLTELIGAKA
jgi:hypothetical protein